MLSAISALLIGTIASSYQPPVVASGVVGLAGYFATVQNEKPFSGEKWAMFGNVKSDTSDKRFGEAALKFGPNSGILDSAVSSVFQLGSSDFTVEAWIKPTTTGTVIAAWSGNSVYRSWRLAVTSAATLSFTFRTASVSTTRTASCTMASGSLTDGAFHHVVAQRRGTVIEVFIDGVRGATSFTVGTDALRTYSFFAPSLGCYSANYVPGDTLQGVIDEVRVTVGSHRYPTFPFVPPTEAFPRSAGTDADFANVVFLSGFNVTSGFQLTGATADKTMVFANDGSSAQDGQISEFGVYGRGGSGSSDQAYIAAISDDALDFGAGDFTIEFHALRLAAFQPAVYGVLGCNSSAHAWRIETVASGTGLRFAFSYDGLSYQPLVDLGSVDTVGYTHFAIVRESGALRIYRNGALFATTTAPSAFATFTGKAFNFVAPDATSGSNFVLRGLRVTKGAALYGGSFTPPLPADYIA